MGISLYSHFTKQEGSFPSKTPANLTHCSRWPSIPPILLHDLASRTVTFTQCSQLATQLHTTTASTTRYVLSLLPTHHPLYTNTTCTQPTHHLHTPPWKHLITPTPHTSHQAEQHMHHNTHTLYTRSDRHTN